MPQVTVYIREEDIAIWKGIRKKAEFIHNTLQTVDAYKALPAKDKTIVKKKIEGIPEAFNSAKVESPRYIPTNNWGA